MLQGHGVCEYCWFVLREHISQSNIVSMSRCKIKSILISKVMLYVPLQWLYNNNNIIKIKPILLLSLYIYLYSEGRWINLGSPYFYYVRVWVMFINEDPMVTVKCRTAIKALFLYFNVCQSVKLDSLSC